MTAVNVEVTNAGCGRVWTTPRMQRSNPVGIISSGTSGTNCQLSGFMSGRAHYGAVCIAFQGGGAGTAVLTLTQRLLGNPSTSLLACLPHGRGSKKPSTAPKKTTPRPSHSMLGMTTARHVQVCDGAAGNAKAEKKAVAEDTAACLMLAHCLLAPGLIASHLL